MSGIWRPSWIFSALALSLGLAAGAGIYTFVYAKGYSYLSDDPKACVNCHVMQEQYDGWVKSSHKTAASCNDCHLPKSLPGKLKVKASNGFWHSFFFTTGSYPEPIGIKPGNWKVAEANCRSCHADTVHAMAGPKQDASQFSCMHCHASVGHPKE